MASPPSPEWNPSPTWIPNPSAPGFWETRGNVGITTCIVFSSISLGTLIARLFTRSRIVHSIGIDDWIIIVAWLFTATFSVLVVIQVSRGLGRHAWDLTYNEYTSFAAPFWASIIFYQLSITFTKSSILLQYLRIFVTQRLRRACWIVFAVVVAYGIWGGISAIFMCTPVPYFWDKTIPGGHCLPEQPVWFGNAAINIATDIAILLLPMPALSHLNLPKKQKIGLMMVLALGGVVCIISVVRFESLYVISISQDVSWDNIPIADWTAVESNIGIMCACLPTLKPLLSRFLPFLMHSSTGGSHPHPHDASRDPPDGFDGKKHTVRVEATGPGTNFNLGQISLFPKPAKALTRLPPLRKPTPISSQVSPRDIEEGRIKVITVVEQEVGDDESGGGGENSSQHNLVWR